MKRLVLIIALVAGSVGIPIAQSRTPSASDWTQWRGNGRDAAISTAADPSKWPEQLTSRWRVEVGLGYATPLVIGDRAYVFARQGENEVMSAIELSDGKVIWKVDYPAPFTMHPAATRHGPGPKSTPVFSNGRLFSIGMTGAVSAFDATTGKLVWQKAGSAVAPMYNTHAFSPIVDGENVVFHVGGHDQGALTAFNMTSGEVTWTWAGDGPSYGSPIIVTLDGVRQLITLTQKTLVGVDASRGTLLWEHPFPSARFVNAATPVSSDRLVIVSNGGPTTAVRILRRDGRWATEVAWENADIPYTFSNALLSQGLLLGLSSRNAGQYFGVDAASGKTVWISEPRQATNAALLRAATGHLISLEDDGELVVGRVTPTAFEVSRRYRVSAGATWTAPAVSGNRLLIKDETALTLWVLN